MKFQAVYTHYGVRVNFNPQREVVLDLSNVAPNSAFCLFVEHFFFATLSASPRNLRDLNEVLISPPMMQCPGCLANLHLTAVTMTPRLEAQIESLPGNPVPLFAIDGLDGSFARSGDVQSVISTSESV